MYDPFFSNPFNVNNKVGKFVVFKENINHFTHAFQIAEYMS